MLKNQCFFVQNFRKDADALLKTWVSRNLVGIRI